MEVSFYLKRADATEPTAIFARISYMGMQLKYYPTIKINPKHWNKEKQQARHGLHGYASFNERLKEIRNDATNLLREYQNSNEGKPPTPEQLKTMLDGIYKPTTEKTIQHTLLTYIEEIIKNSKSGIRLNPKTGKPITKKHGEKWECTDLTVEEKYCSLSMVIKNSLNEKTTITYDYCFNEYSKGRVYFAKDASLYRKKFGDVNWFKVLDGKVVVGFTQEMTLLAWGKPDKINKASYGSQWVYENQYLYFKNGKLISFN